MSFDLGNYWNLAIEFFYSCVLSLVEMIKDIFIWFFDSFMTICVTVVDSFGSMMTVFDITKYFNDLPVSVSNVMGLIGLGTCTQMIASAILIRILLQLIPFVRLGS